MNDKYYFAIMVILAALFSASIGMLVHSLQVQADSAAQPQQYTVTIEFIPTEPKQEGK